MKAPAFWNHGQKSLLSSLLAPIAGIYGSRTAKRALQPARFKADIPVICIGNLTMGGAGKTPSAITICETLKQAGKNPVFLSRGYGGKLEGPVMVDAQSATDVGDEPLLLRQYAPVCVSRNRVAGAKACMESGADVIIMDDGYQNPHLHKDISFLVIDGGFGHGNEKVFPAGPLRETLENGLQRCDAILFIGEDVTQTKDRLKDAAPHLPILDATITPKARPDLSGKSCIAFAGIGRPEKFFATLRNMGITLAAQHSFGDHHPYSTQDITRLRKEAEQLNASLITTEKDLVRLPQELRRHIDVIKIKLDFGKADMLHGVLRDILEDSQ
ncbi:tetraacyldisaccharide 4'-kinase [Terasakiella sp. A23]|uniref:tetraacyldisaccharide 4'-kinase n=1 Tax=Terasakiella sp. FCG-A23 TaxID=3080561 RepID=UPI002952EA3F|nr:tetraacyldisaccharide 4'-kinase [Terasakiella sp. A23]MDV7338026.1 tetraacyldisaccharide 4'-kinase [Terasakiella sp. A23]